MSGNGSFTNSIDSGSMPAFSAEARTASSTTFWNVLTATFFPARSRTDLIGLPAPTINAPKSSPSTPVELVPLLTTFAGRPSDCASNRVTTLLKPNCWLPLSTDGTVSAPPSAGWSVSSMFRSARKPLSFPR